MIIQSKKGGGNCRSKPPTILIVKKEILEINLKSFLKSIIRIDMTKDIRSPKSPKFKAHMHQISGARKKSKSMK